MATHIRKPGPRYDRPGRPSMKIAATVLRGTNGMFVAHRPGCSDVKLAVSHQGATIETRTEDVRTYFATKYGPGSWQIGNGVDLAPCLRDR